MDLSFFHFWSDIYNFEYSCPWQRISVLKKCNVSKELDKFFTLNLNTNFLLSLEVKWNYVMSLELNFKNVMSLIRTYNLLWAYCCIFLFIAEPANALVWFLSGCIITWLLQNWIVHVNN